GVVVPARVVSGSFPGARTATLTLHDALPASAPAFPANAVVGSYTVTATVAGVSAGATFSLSNTTGAAWSITATTGTPQSAAVGTALTTPFQATVNDQYPNPATALNATFTAPT